ncbi:hypothetical protein BKI52_29340 [marine bacterium AO1-C]|nr:hypothetical protein BKI52_29340 [marine bacterium AO1-C]
MNKKQFVFLNFCALLTFGTLCSIDVMAQNTVNISGQISHHKTAKISVYYFTDYIQYSQKIAKTTLDDQGKFSLDIAIQQRQPAFLKYGRVSVPILLEPGKPLQVQADASQLSSTIKFIGKNGGDNQYLIAYYQRFMANGKQYAVYDYIKKMTPSEFLSYLKTERQAQIQFLESYQKQASLSAAFVQYQTQTYQIQYWSNLLGYPRNKVYFTGKQVTLPKDYYSTLPKKFSWKDEWLVSADYQSFMGYYLGHKFHQKYPNKTTTSDYYYFVKNAMKNQNASRAMHTQLAKIVYGGLSGGNLPLSRLQGIYNDFMALNSMPQLRELLKVQYQLAKQLDKGKAAPTFTLKNLAGKQVSLSDFKGKVIYLDFWASWCKPCMKEVPHAKKLKEKLQGQPVAFLYISVDENDKMWKRAIERKQIKGEHLVAPGMQHAVAQAYNARSIPRYVIIDKAGNIWHRNASRPSGRAYQQIMAALDSK